jgi:ArsR family transcriptional regulator, arsenate/arsenite/antimonite-responsive transcriptional repressor
MDEVIISLKALSEEIRIRIVLLLIDREACVCELMEVFGMAQSKLSHHLLMLRDAGILQDEKRVKWNYYRINTKILTTVNKELLLSLTRWLDDDDIVEKDRRALLKVNKCTVPA